MSFLAEELPQAMPFTLKAALKVWGKLMFVYARSFLNKILQGDFLGLGAAEGATVRLLDLPLFFMKLT